MTSVTTAVHPDKESVYFQGSLTQMQAKQYSNINRDNVTFMEIIKTEPRKQSYTDTTEFDNIIGKFPFLSNKFIYKKVIDDARVIPDNIVMKNRMDEYFSPRFYKNLLRMYQNSPLYFDYLFSREGITDQRHKQYSVYIYTLCMIEYIMKHYDSNDFKLIDNYQLYYDWALPKYSEQISYIIKGPLSKSSSIKIDFKKHYASIMNPSNVEGDMTPVLQLASLQNLDSKMNAILRFMMEMPNVYNKTPDHARTYNLVIRARNTKCYNDPLMNNTFVIDLRGSDFGETDYTLASTASLDTVVNSSFDVSSRLSLHHLQRLFTKYSRFRIVSLNVNRELYNIKLDTLDSINVVIGGISLSSRTVNLINSETSKDSVNNSFNVPGSFSLSTNNIITFKPFIDTTSYDSGKVRVTDARLYLTYNDMPLSAKTLSLVLNQDKLFNVVYVKSNPVSDLYKTVSLIKPMKYSGIKTIVDDDLTILQTQSGVIHVTFNDIIRKSWDNAYNNDSPIIPPTSKFTYSYTVVGVDGIQTIESSNYPSNIDEAREILNLGVNDTLSSLTITMGDSLSVIINTSLLTLPMEVFTYSEFMTNIMVNICSQDIFPMTELSAPVVRDSTLTGLGYGYYVLFHYSVDGSCTIHSLTPNSFVIYPDNISNLEVTISCETEGTKSALYLYYTYANNTDAEDEDEIKYSPIQLTTVQVKDGDRFVLYFYDAINGVSRGYKAIPTSINNYTQFDVTWYNYPVLIHLPTDIITISGKFHRTRMIDNMYISQIKDNTSSLCMINRFVPILNSDHIPIKGAILLDALERIGYGNEQLNLRTNDKTLYNSLSFTSWETITIIRSLYMQELPISADTILGFENTDDLFNIQIEFS